MPLNRPSILCVGNDDSRLDTRRSLLEAHGYQVFAAAGTRESLDLLVRHAIDLVLLDDKIPATNGDMVAARMKAVKPRVPVVMLLAHSRLPQDKPAYVDAVLSQGESWANVLACMEELLAPDLPFFARWLADWKRRRAVVMEGEAGEQIPARNIEKRSA